MAESDSTLPKQYVIDPRSPEMRAIDERLAELVPMWEENKQDLMVVRWDRDPEELARAMMLDLALDRLVPALRQARADAEQRQWEEKQRLQRRGEFYARPREKYEEQAEPLRQAIAAAQARRLKPGVSVIDRHTAEWQQFELESHLRRLTMEFEGAVAEEVKRQVRSDRARLLAAKLRVMNANSRSYDMGQLVECRRELQSLEHGLSDEELSAPLYEYSAAQAAVASDDPWMFRQSPSSPLKI